MAAAGAARRRSRAVPGILLGALSMWGLAACGSSDDNPYGLTEFQGGSSVNSTQAPAGAGGSGSRGSGSSAASGSGTTRPVPSFESRPVPSGAVTYRPSDVFSQGAWVERGQIAAGTAGQRSIVSAALAYLSARVQLSNTWQVNEPALTAVSVGQALASALDRADGQKSAQQRSIGPFELNLASVKVTAGAAVDAGCSYDGTSEISDQGSVLSDPPGGVRLSMKLVRGSSGWRVSTFPADATFCEAPQR
jgi:hypothetical protein